MQSASNLQFSSPAEADVADSAFWYEGQQTGLGAQFIDELDAALARVRSFPLSYPQVSTGVRRALLRRFPFSVYFRVSGNVIEVLAVLHQHRDPSAWETRLKISG